MARRLLIVGAGMATGYLLQSLQGFEHDLEITVCGAERDLCYNRVLLSNVLAGEVPETELAMFPDEPPTGTRFLANTRIERIDLDQRVAYPDRGPAMPFDLLVLATGAQVAPLPFDCRGVGGVRYFRSLADTRALRSLRGSGRGALVVGGGLLGLEAAHGLNELSFRTAVLHRNPVLMNRQLDAEGGACLRRKLEQRGIEFHLGCSPTALKSEAGQIRAVVLDDGRHLPCDLLLLATGIVPNTALAEAAGLDCARGVRIDRQLQTSAPGVYAIGECAQLEEHCFGLVAPIRAQAEVLAATLAGSGPASYSVEDTPTQLKISGVEIFRAGELDSAGEQLLLRDPAAGIYRRLVIRDQCLVGAVLVGDKRGGNHYAQLIADKTDIAALRQDLMFGADKAATAVPSVAAA